MGLEETCPAAFLFAKYFEKMSESGEKEGGRRIRICHCRLKAIGFRLTLCAGAVAMICMAVLESGQVLGSKFVALATAQSDQLRQEVYTH
jgi:hypothetical protein